MRPQKLPVLFLFCYFLSVSVFGQNWKWEWYKQSTQKDVETWTDILNIDFNNNIYTGTWFGDSVFFADTVFTSGNIFAWSNRAIVKYDEQGKFQNAFDIVSSPHGYLFNLQMISDRDMNLYIAGEFEDTIYFLDTVVVSVLNSTDLFIAKINPELKVDWIHQIRSNSQDACRGFSVSSDNYLYLATVHQGNSWSYDTVIYMEQDTAFFYSSLSSLLKIDFDGNLLWRKEIHSDSGAVSIMEINNSSFNKTIVNGYTRDNIYFSNDTVFHPYPGEYMRRPFIIEVDSSGALIRGIIPDWDMVLLDTYSDESGNFFFYAGLWGTTYFGNDTLTFHKDSTINLFSKLDSNFDPVWYALAKTRKGLGQYWFWIDVFQDTMYIAGQIMNKVILFDTVLDHGAPQRGFIGKVSPEGVLEKYILIETTAGFHVTGLKLDNCGNNLFTAGGFTGHAYIGDDTLVSYNLGWDGIVAKLNLYDLQQFNFGADTTVCDSIRLAGPEGYKYYYWNGQLSEQNWFDVTKSGTYMFAATGDDGCWIRDTVNINVQPGFSIDLGQDTVIGLTDTLYLSVPDVYDSYLWSTGSIDHSIEITGNMLGQGDWSVWLKVTQGACQASDTILLTVSNVDELQDFGVSVYPNPAGNTLNVISERKIEKIELINNKGIVVLSKRIQSISGKRTFVDISNIPAGLYFIRIYFDDRVGSGKIIKL